MSKNNIKVNAIASTLVRILNIIFPLLTGPYLTRILDPELFGEFNKVNSLAAWFIPFAGFGVYNYGIRLVSGVRENKAKASHNFSLLFYASTLSSIVVTLVYILYIWFANPNNMLLYGIFIFQIIVQFLYVEWMAEAFESYNFILYKTLFVRVFMLVSIFVFVKNSDDIIPYAMIMTVANFLNYFTSYIYIRRKVKLVRIPLKELVKVFKPLFSMLLLANANMLYTILDRLFLSSVKNNLYISYYTISLNLSMMITGVVVSIIIVSIPRLAKYNAEEQFEKFNDLQLKTSRLFLFLVIPISMGLACVSQSIIFLYAGPKYILAVPTMIICSIRILSWTLDTIFANQIIFLKGHELSLTRIYFVGGFFNLIFNSALYIFGIENPEYYILTTVFAEVIVLFLEVKFIRDRSLYDIRKIKNNFIRYTIASLPFIAIKLAVDYFIPFEYNLTNGFMLNTGWVIVGCVVYYALFAIISGDIKKVIKL